MKWNEEQVISRLCNHFHFRNLVMSRHSFVRDRDWRDAIEENAMFDECFSNLDITQQHFLREVYVYNSEDLSKEKIKIKVDPDIWKELAQSSKMKREDVQRITSEAVTQLAKNLNDLEGI